MDGFLDANSYPMCTFGKKFANTLWHEFYIHLGLTWHGGTEKREGRMEKSKE